MRAQLPLLRGFAVWFLSSSCLLGCSGPKLTSASAESGCPSCDVLAESTSAFVELEMHAGSLFVLDELGTISSFANASGALTNVAPSGTNAQHFGVSASSLAWVALDDSSDPTTERVHALGLDGTPGPTFDAFNGNGSLTVGLSDAFAGAFTEGASGSEVRRYSLADGTVTLPAETLTDEEAATLPLIAGGDDEVVWCRSHADGSSSSWRLGKSGTPQQVDNAFACAGLWSNGNGQVFTLDSSTGQNCLFSSDATNASQQLACTSSSIAALTPLADGSAAFISGESSVSRIDSAGIITQLFSASEVLGLESDGDTLYYATPAHIGRVAWRSLL